MHASYDALIADPEVDAIYIATPHTHHCDPTIACLEGGKPVLCGFVVNGAQVERMVSTAKARGVFLMEAMWTRFLPIYDVVRQWIDDGAIGELRMVQGSFGFRSGWNLLVVCLILN